MLKIFEKEYLNSISILNYQLLGDILYILLKSFDENVCNNNILKLVKINMRKRETIVNVGLLQHCKYIPLGIMDKKVYIRNRENFLSVYNVDNIYEPTWPKINFVEHIIMILEIKNKIYYMCGHNGEIVNIVDPDKDSVFLKIKFNCKEVSFVNDIVFTTTKFSDTVLSFDEYLVFYSIDENFYIKFNLDTKKYVVNKISNESIKISNKYYLYNYSNRGSYFYHLKEKIYYYDFKEEVNVNIPEEFLHKCELNHFVDINSYIGHIKYDNVNYYFALNDDNLSMYSDISFTMNKIIDNHKIVIGSKRNKIEICSDMLISRSGFVADLFKDVNQDNKEIISNNLDDIEVYRKFIYDGEVKHRNLHKLLFICNFLHDVDINYVGELIIKHVEGDINMKITLDEAYEYLNLLHKCLCYVQLNRLTHLIFKKYRNVGFMNKIMNSISDLNNYLIKELIINI